MGASLSQQFLAALPPVAASAFRREPELEAQLRAILAAARERWPNLSVTDSEFLQYVGARWPADATVRLGALQLSDLYLACALARRDSRAIRALEERILPRVHLRRRDRSPELVEEIRQELLRRLFVADGEQQPRILKYTGKGSLEAWVAVTATHIAVDLQRRQPVEETLDDKANDLLQESDPELAFIKRRYRSEFKLAFRQALEQISPHHRRVLRQSVLEGLSIDALGDHYGVHRATAARWLVAARKELLDQTRALLTQKLRVSTGELDSLLGMIRSQLDVSLTTLMKPDDG